MVRCPIFLWNRGIPVVTLLGQLEGVQGMGLFESIGLIDVSWNRILVCQDERRMV